MSRLHSVEWPTLVFVAVTTVLNRDNAKAYLGWCELMIKETLNSFLGGAIEGNGYELSQRQWRLKGHERELPSPEMLWSRPMTELVLL